MDHIKILKRALKITLDYRVLWIFGMILALTTASGGGGGNGGGGGGGGGNGSSNGGGFPPIRGIHLPEISDQFWYGLAIAGVVLICAIFLLSLVFAVARYISETALIRMVDQHENTGEKLSFRQGLRLGWSKAAFRLFLIDLVIGLAGAIILILLMVIAGAPLLLWLFDNVAIGAFGTLLSIGMGMLLIFAGILVAIALSLLIQFFRRACVLENLGVFESFRRGFMVLKRRLGDVVIMGLIMFGLGLAWVILTVPVVILLVLAGTFLGGLPALLVGMIAGLFSGGVIPWVLAAVVGLPIFILVLSLPMLFLSGIVKVFASSTWTLTYREVLALNGDLPAPETKPRPLESDKADESGAAVESEGDEQSPLPEPESTPSE